MTAPESKSYGADGPVALVIGCGDIGMGCARRLGARHPLFIVDVDAARLDAALGALREEGFAASGGVCDITKTSDVDAVAEDLSKTGIRVLAHVAAVGPTIGDWRKMMAINLVGPALVARRTRPLMKRGAVAVFVSSAGGHNVGPDAALDRVLDDPLAADFIAAFERALGREPDLQETYCWSKRGLMAMARRLAVNWGRDGVRALSISPGMIDTGMGRRDGALAPGRAALVEKIPLGRQGSIQEVAAVLAFLASDEASFVTGIDLLIDGGRRAELNAR